MNQKKRIDKKANSLYSTFNKLGIKLSMDELREMIKKADICPYCTKTMKPKELSVDHIVPRSRGGSDDMSNLHLVCKECNLLKGNLLEEEFDRLKKFLADNPDIAAQISRRLRASGFLYRR